MAMRINDAREFLSEDKRKSERLALPVKILYSFPPLEEWLGPLLVDDISGHGLKFTADSPIEKDSVFKLKILFPDEAMRPIVVEAQVYWCVENRQGYSIGVKFYQMNHTDHRRYVEYIGEKILLKHLK